MKKPERGVTMRKYFGFGLVIWSVAVVFASPGYAENLIKNGDFSQGMSGWSTYTWVIPKGEKARVVPRKKDIAGRISELDKEVSKEGLYSHKIFLSDKSPLTWAGYATWVDIEPKTAYHFSGWIQGKDIHGGRGAGIGITELNARGEPLNNFRMGGSLFGTFPWKKIEKSFTTKSGTVRLMICESIMMYGTVWFDGFTLTPNSGDKSAKNSGRKKPSDNSAATGQVKDKFNFSPTGDRDIVIKYDFRPAKEKMVFSNKGRWDLSNCIGVRFDYKGNGSNRTFEIALKDIKGTTRTIGFGNLRRKEKKEAIWRIDFASIPFYDSNVKEILLTINNRKGENPRGSMKFSNIEFLYRGTLSISDKQKRTLDNIASQLKKVVASAETTVRILPDLSMINAEPVVPEDYPTFKDERVKPVTRKEVGYGFHGTTQSDPQYLDWYYKFYDFGDTLKPYCWYVTNPDWKNTIKEVLDRGLYIDGVWGYVPKRDAANSHFVIGDEKFNWLKKTGGKYFLGFEDGEQDNRFLWNCGGSNRQEAYEDFKAFSKAVQKDLHNYTVTLATHPMIHYYGEFGSRLLGFEFNVGMPSEIMRASFLRGAGKQYGRLTQTSLSVWGTNGLKTYNKKDFYRGGPDKGPSLSLIRRQFYLSYLYGCSFSGIEYSQFTGEWKEGKPELSPLGEINLEALNCFKQHPERGVTYAPVGLVLDFYHGWMAPVTKGQFLTWGHFPYKRGDWQIYNMFRLIFPYYEDQPMTFDERGSLTATPYGDIFEVILNDAPEHVLEMYNSLVLYGENEIKGDLKERLKSYVKKGGQVVLFYPQIAGADSKFLGLQVGSGVKEALGSAILYNKKVFVEPGGYDYIPVTPTTAKVIAINENLDPLITVNSYGKGKVIYITAEYGMSKKLKYAYPSLSYAEPKYDLLKGVKHFLADYFKEHDLIEVKGKGIQYVTNLFKEEKNKLVLTLVNNNRFQPWKGEVAIPGTKITEANEWIEGKMVTPAPEGTLKLSIPPGDLRIYTIKTDSPFWPK